jgi:hypothetical protein
LKERGSSRPIDNSYFFVIRKCNSIKSKIKLSLEVFLSFYGCCNLCLFDQAIDYFSLISVGYFVLFLHLAVGGILLFLYEFKRFLYRNVGGLVGTIIQGKATGLA